MSKEATPYYLRGNFAPVTDEIDAFDLEVRGTLPPDLVGLYLRNGPNPHPGQVPPHWWYGAGMLHGIRLERGRAIWYRNRWVGGSSNTHVFAHGGRILSFVESSLPMELSETLETIGPYDFGGVRTPFTAHAKICPTTGELWGLGYQAHPPYVTVYRIDAAGRLLESRPVDVDGACYMHDCALTENFFVLFDSPYRMLREWSQGYPFAWQEGRPTRIGLVPRAGGDVRWLEAAPSQLGHTANAFERDGKVVLDGERLERMPGPSVMSRWEIDLERGRVRERAFDGRFCLLPRIDDRRTGLPYRYAYAAEARDLDANGIPAETVIRRYDVETGASLEKDFGRRYALWELIFVPAAGSRSEEDGWLLGLRYDRERDTSELYVLDARDFEADPVAVVQLPRRVPYGIHASWVPTAS